MDIFSHAIAGAATGSIFGRPGLGALIAITPDLPLIGKRRATPPALYDFAHSFIFVLCSGAVLYQFDLAAMGCLCLLSHIVLDLPTHGKLWGPSLLYPHHKRFSYGDEWEFFNGSWVFGLLITITWSSICLLIQL